MIRLIFSRVWKFQFRIYLLIDKLKDSSLPYYLPIARERIVGFISFSRVLALYEILSCPAFEL